MNPILLLKINRLFRAIKALPVFASLICTALIAGVFYLLYFQFKLTPNTYFIWGVFTILLYSLHRNRKDIDFCYLILPNPLRLFITEYYLFFSPLIILSIITQTYLNTVLYALTPLFIGVLPTKKRIHFNIPIPALLQVESLETISFLRKYFFLIFAIVLASLVFCYIPFLSLFILLLLVLVINNAYMENEPLNMVFLPEKSSAKFLWEKVRTGYALYLKLSIPALILYAVFHIRTAYFVTIPLLAGLVGISLFVFIKYSLYEANNERIVIPLAASLGMVGLVIPILIPIPALMAWKYYYSAKNNMNKYLYVYDK